ncbi:MAG: hypothetical protein ACK5TN_23885 [Acidobacteriota bacterium]|jgi:hypothetical protein
MITVAVRESIQTKLTLALMLRDAFTGKPELVGEVEVAIENIETGWRKPLESTFLFKAAPNGVHIIAVRSKMQPPVYLPVNITVTLPLSDALWPGYPDRSVADLSLPFDSPFQPSLFRSQYLETSLKPTAAYPFPGDATLVRGTVSSALGPLDEVTVSDASGLRYRTGPDGEFAVFMAPYRTTTVLTFQRAGFTDVVHAVNLPRQGTAILNVLMT